MLTTCAAATEVWLADQNEFPGKIWHVTTDGHAELQHRRNPTADRAFPNAIMKVGGIAAARDGSFYFCSGLDGSVLALLDARHEVLSFDFPGQVRDISTGGEDHTVYFSVVPTPQDGEPLADGKIFRRDIWQGAPVEVASVRQSDLGGNWWGTFTVRDGVIFLATTEPRSRLFRLTSGRPEPVFTGNSLAITGLEAGRGQFFVAEGSGQIQQTTDFTSFTPVASGGYHASDVTVREE